MKTHKALNYFVQSVAAAGEQRRTLNAARAAGDDVYEDMIVFVDDATGFDDLTTDEMQEIASEQETERMAQRLKDELRPFFAPVVQNRDDAFYRTAGYNAQRLGLTSFQCPYKAPDKRARLWVEGYGNAKREAAPPMEVTDPLLRPASAAPVASNPSPFRSRVEFKQLMRERSRFSTKFMDRKREINYKRVSK